MNIEQVLAVYRQENGNAGNNISHVRDLIIDLLHYVDATNQGISSYELLEIVQDMFTEEKVEYSENASENQCVE